MVYAENGVDVLHALGPDIGKLLDFGGSVFDLIVGEVELELLNTTLDCVPAS